MGIRLTIDGEQVEIEEGESLLDAIRNMGVAITSPCGGKGSCGKCLVRIISASDLPEPNTKETSIIEKEDLDDGYRLACQIIPVNSMSVEIPEDSREVTIELLLKHARLKRINEPALSIRIISLPVGDDPELLSKQIESLLQTEGLSYGPQWDTSRLKEVIGQVNATVWIDGSSMVDLSRVDDRRIGVALDIGSTTMVAYCFEILDQKIVAVESMTNPQRKFGEDVMSRIDLAMKDPEKGRMLTDELRTGVLELLSKVTGQVGLSTKDIIRLYFVGNTAMHHFFLGLDVTKLGRVPFSPETKDPVDIRASEMGLGELPNAVVSAPPLVAGFVGADLVSVLLATDLSYSEVPTAAIDIGTNAEIAIASNGKIICASAAAGPAFEGGNISHGMRATDGAICSVWTEDGELKYETMGDAEPIGLCGSGLIDFIAEALKLGIVDSSGKFVPECCGKRLIGRAGNTRFILYSEGKKEVSVNQADIRQLQLAKAAIYAGLEILTEKLEIGKIGRLLLAGAFGTNMSARNGRTIGMFPELPLDRIVPVGNAAGTGAIQLLTDNWARTEILEISKRTNYVELSEERVFQSKFISALDFPHSDFSRYPESSKFVKYKKERNKSGGG